MFVLVIINAMINLKQFGLVVLICVELTGQVVDSQGPYLVVGHAASNNNNNNNFDDRPQTYKIYQCVYATWYKNK